MTMDEAMAYANEKEPKGDILLIVKIANAYIEGALYQQKKDIKLIREKYIDKKI